MQNKKSPKMSFNLWREFSCFFGIISLIFLSECSFKNDRRNFLMNKQHKIPKLYEHKSIKQSPRFCPNSLKNVENQPKQ